MQFFTRHSRRLGIIAIMVAAMCFIATENTFADDNQPSTVFVYNDGEANEDRETDTFDHNAKGFILQSMGLVDSNGKPGTVGEDGKIRDDDGNVLGEVIKDGDGQVIGYRSADGSKEAYDVSAGATTRQAWERVASDGELHIIKHGSCYQDAEGNVHHGGGIRLDDQRIFDGFAPVGNGDGTGVGYAGSDGTANGPYRLPPRPDANITVNVNSCWSDSDPDGEGPADSVTGSARDVNGVGETKGHSVEVEAKVTWSLSGTEEQTAAATGGLQQAAEAAGFSAIGEWIASLPFDEQYRSANEAIEDSGAALKLEYSKSEKVEEAEEESEEPESAGSGKGGRYASPLLLSPMGPPICYGFSEFTGSWEDIDPLSNALANDLRDAFVRIDAETVWKPMIIHMRHVPVDESFPSEVAPLSGAFTFSVNNMDALTGNAMSYFLEFEIHEYDWHGSVRPVYSDGDAWEDLSWHADVRIVEIGPANSGSDAPLLRGIVEIRTEFIGLIAIAHPDK